MPVIFTRVIGYTDRWIDKPNSFNYVSKFKKGTLTKFSARIKEEKLNKNPQFNHRNFIAIFSIFSSEHITHGCISP